MAQETYTVLYCDNHLKKDPSEKVEGKAFPAQLGMLPTRVVDLCDPCRESMTLSQLETLLSDVGRSVDLPSVAGVPEKKERKRRAPNTPEARPFPCPDPGNTGCKHRAPNRGALGGHMKAMHNTSLTQWESDSSDVETPFRCRFCSLSLRNGMARQTHEWVNHPDEYRKAKAEAAAS